ncbi:diacylglycerol kinase, partial [Clostridium perfringens]
AVEAIIDLISPEEHVLARVAKDTAAGAALVAAVFAVVIGILVFYEPVWEWIQSMTS